MTIWNHPWTCCGLTLIAFGIGLTLGCTENFENSDSFTFSMYYCWESVFLVIGSIVSVRSKWHNFWININTIKYLHMFICWYIGYGMICILAPSVLIFVQMFHILTYWPIIVGCGWKYTCLQYYDLFCSLGFRSKVRSHVYLLIYWVRWGVGEVKISCVWDSDTHPMIALSILIIITITVTIITIMLITTSIIIMLVFELKGWMQI